jgi:hypothetical protein
MTVLIRIKAKSNPTLARTIEIGTPELRILKARKVMKAPLKVGDSS